MPPTGLASAPPHPPGVRTAGRVPLTGFYLLYFAGVGITLPFLPQWFRSLGLTGAEIGLLLATGPAMMLVVPPLWGWVVDRTGRPDRALWVITAGVVLAFAPLAALRSFPALLLCMAAYSFFVSSITPVLDSVALQRVAAHGGSFARIRLFGSIGFVLSSTAFGVLVPVIDVRAVFAALLCMAAYFAWSFTLRARNAAGPARHPLAGVALLRHRDLALMLAASSLHWIANAPYNGTFGIHVTALGLPPWVIGVSAGLGVVSEVAVLFLYPRFADAFAPRHVLAVAFVASAVRWAGMALTADPYAIVALSLLHGLSFGAFYVAAVAFVARRVPESFRASGQALFASITFGLGGLLGYLGAGSAYEWLGGHGLFGAAAALELVPAALVLLVHGVRPVTEARG